MTTVLAMVVVGWLAVLLVALAVPRDEETAGPPKEEP